MNYRHSYHAGNAADVIKHCVLTRILLYLQRKSTPFWVLDTHAGCGLYDLQGAAADKTGEWRGGIGRVFSATFSEVAERLLAPYRYCVAAVNADGELRFYPGSPVIIQTLARPEERVTLIEQHPEDADVLRQVTGRDRRIKVICLDGWMALTAYLPPKERRGVILIDPPFEHPQEFRRMADKIIQAHEVWPQGLIMAWYPIKHHDRVREFMQAMDSCGAEKRLFVESFVTASPQDGRFDGAGLMILNPPWVLEQELADILPVLTRCLAQDERGHWSIGPQSCMV